MSKQAAPPAPRCSSPEAAQAPGGGGAAIDGTLATGACVGFLAPSGTPAAIVSRLSAEVANILQAPDIRGKLTEQARYVIASTREQFGSFVRSEHDKLGKLIKDANLNIAQ
ncbi:MAG: hypothetical protein HYU73_14400 [Betaproteobacteria bacterium]|nr:hypothetical protein [Betaproteobacteria bacterium]